MTDALTKSYVNTTDPEHPVREDLVLYQLFENARNDGHVGEIVCLENGQRMTTIEILNKADQYAKGMLALKLTAGEDTLTVIGCPSLESACLFTAACSIGISYAHPYIYEPRESSVAAVLPLLQSRVAVVGEGAGGEAFDALQTFFEDCETPTSTKLPFVEHLFYDDTYKNRSPTQKYIKTLDRLRELGESVTDEQLKEAKKRVKPEHALHNLFTSGSTGKPKCVAHTHRGLANELLQLRVTNAEATLTMNPNIDEMISYAFIAWTLSGKVSKTVFTPDMRGDLPAEEMARLCTNGIIAENVEHIALPGGFQQLICNCSKTESIKIPAQKVFLNGAQLVSRQFKQDLMDVFQGTPLTVYGMCETFILAFTTFGTEASDHEARMEARLYPKPNSELRLVNENNEIVDIGTDGEIQVKTYSFLKEYRTEEKKTRELFTDDGFLRTGDMAVMFSDGTFVIKGRAADAIRFKVFGDVIYPGPIEEVVSQYPGVSDVSVVAGGFNDKVGDELTYCIRLNEGVCEPTYTDLWTYCEESGLDTTQRPARVIYLNKFPTTANSRKVSKTLLRKKVYEMIEGDSTVGITQWFIQLQQDLNG